MSYTILTRLVSIGNSRGFRIPKTVIEQLGLADEIEMEIRDDELVLRPRPKARAGWDAGFKAMRTAGDDTLISASAVPTKWDEEEWEW